MNTTTLDLIALHARLVDSVAALDTALEVEESTSTGMPIDVMTGALAGLADGMGSNATLGASLWGILTDYRDAVNELVALRAVADPKNPTAERRRILAKAEKLSDDSGTPDRVRALIDLAAEWGRAE